MLNKGIRPLLAKWHPLLQTWESQRPPHLSPKAHEQNWSEEKNIRNELELLRKDLEQYANALSRLALKIVVGAREQGTLNWEQEESFGRFYFSSHTFKFFSSPT